MLKKLTITVDAEVYNGLHSVIGRRRISRFLNDLAALMWSAKSLLPDTPRWRPTRHARPRQSPGARRF